MEDVAIVLILNQLCCSGHRMEDVAGSRTRNFIVDIADDCPVEMVEI
jgi:hypothetical protein